MEGKTNVYRGQDVRIFCLALGGIKMKLFRPIIISVLTAAAVTGFFLKLVNAEAFWVFATGLIMFWFKSRDEDKGNK